MPPVIDLMIRIKNAYLAGNETVTTPFSKFRESVVKKLVQLGYVKSYDIIGESKKSIVIDLAYKGTKPVFTDIRIHSKPGQRIYIPVDEIKPVLGGLGHAIISTPNGILTNKEAKKQNVGGELLFYIW